MSFLLEAACLCCTGKARKNNEDNFYFNDRCLAPDNQGLKHPVAMTKLLDREIMVAVFDGMGGEDCGKTASFTAAECLKAYIQKLRDYYIPEKAFLCELSTKLNEAVLLRKRELRMERMGSTFAGLFFSRDYVYVCNLGDSRAYRLRDGEFMQLTEDHVEKRKGVKNSPLSQYLGIDPEEKLLQPYVAKGELKHRDQYILCSGGLTDMLSNFEIDGIMCNTNTAEDCAKELVEAALEKGGKDNVTVIVCRVY